MTQRYNTGNPRPSNSMKDLNDNALAYDDFLNSESDTFVDRMGNTQDSLRGAKEKMAAAGAAVVDETRRNLIPLSKQYVTLADAQADNSASQPVMVRVYVLKDRKTFDKTVYQQLAAEGEDILKDDQLASRSLVLKPGTEMSLTMPLDEQAQYVAVVALFRAPDLTKNDWKLVLAREDLDPDRARVIEASHHQLVLQPRKEK